MINRLKIATFLCAAIFAASIPQAMASEWDETTAVTFSAPVEIPGQVLMPGSYVFKLADSASDRNVVQVFNSDQTHLYGTFLTIPDYQSQPADKPIISFEEREAGAPEAVKAWFYAGETFGHDFVYPKAKAAELAKANNAPVPSMPNELAANTTKPASTMQEPHVREMKKAALTVQMPDTEEVQITEVFALLPPSPSQSDLAPKLPKELPHTASSLPLLLMIGVLMLGTACMLHRRTAVPNKAKN